MYIQFLVWKWSQLQRTSQLSLAEMLVLIVQHAWSYGRVYYYWYVEYTNGTTSYYDPYKRCDANCGSYPTLHKQEFGISYATEVHTFKVINADEQYNEGWYCWVAVNECGNTSKCGWLEVDNELAFRQLYKPVSVLSASPVIINTHHTLLLEKAVTGSLNCWLLLLGKSNCLSMGKILSISNSWSSVNLRSIRGIASPSLTFRPGH